MCMFGTYAGNVACVAAVWQGVLHMKGVGLLRSSAESCHFLGLDLSHPQAVTKVFVSLGLLKSWKIRASLSFVSFMGLSIRCHGLGVPAGQSKVHGSTRKPGIHNSYLIPFFLLRQVAQALLDAHPQDASAAGVAETLIPSKAGPGSSWFEGPAEERATAALAVAPRIILLDFRSVT